MSQHERVTIIRPKALDLKKQYIAYWCYNTLRTRYNHALEYAIHLANKYTLPLIVFTTNDTHTTNTLSSNRHILFNMQTKQTLCKNLAMREIICYHLFGYPPAIAAFIAQEAVALVVDTPYFNQDKDFYGKLVQWSKSPIIQIESNVVVPIESTSDTLEHARYTIRPKILKQIEKFLVPISHQSVENPSLHYTHPHLQFPASYFPPAHKFQKITLERNDDICRPEFLQNIFAPSFSIVPCPIRGGEDAAQHTLSHFINNRFINYDALHNDPSAEQGNGCTSNLSHYLCNGAISPIDIIIQIKIYIESQAKIQSVTKEYQLTLQESYKTFFEQLVIGRELAYNFVYYDHYYDKYHSIPHWAKNTLESHKSDPRPYIYSPERMENATTDDPYWNAAQLQLTSSGMIHGYMRVYWSKKILEWVAEPQDAFEFTIAQNNKYALDAPDPTGYAGIAWCYGTHDRPNLERPIFGTIRYINANQLRKYFKIDDYVKRWNYAQHNHF